MSDPKELARERKRRQRAREKQVKQLEFIRTDASLFLHPDRLSQKAGAPKHLLRRMAIKEIVDNALDASPTAILTMVDADTFVIQDDGGGIDPVKVPTMFSVTRPMMSTKLIRRPTRGMVGNGNRVVAGAAFASGGGLTVESRGVRQELSFAPQSGETIVIDRADSEVTEGTRITIRFGAALPRDEYATVWGDAAIRLAGNSAKPMLTHPDWYSEASFAELIGAARGSAQDLADLFGVDLCHADADPIEQDEFVERDRDIGHADNGQIVQGQFIDQSRDIRSLTLEKLKALAPKAPVLVPITETAFSGSYKVENIQANVAGATVPAIIQVWATSQAGNTRIALIVNRTPAVADMSVRVGGDAFISGCGLQWEDIGTVPKGDYGIIIAVTTPAVALISDGKTPDLSPFKEGLKSAVGQALRRAHRPKRRGISIKDAAYEIMDVAYRKASASGTLPANARQIMYAARPYILEVTGQDKLADAYFTQTLLPSFMEENPELTSDWDVVYDARGHLVEPHTKHSLPLGTLRVREYMHRRPRHDVGSLVSANVSGLHPTAGPGDRYGTVLFIEKEGFEPLLRASRIAERYDLAVMSTKGMSVIAARALVDHLSASGIKILVAHDLDMAGIRIFGTLGADSNRYQFKHQPDIRRLGLTLEQALEMKLQDERQEVKGDHDRIIEGLKSYGATASELKFITSGRRVELNAMPSDQFIEWIERGLQAHGVQKIIPSLETIEQRARQIIAVQHIHDEIRKLENLGREYASTVSLPDNLTAMMRDAFRADPTAPWEEALLVALQNNGGDA